MAISATLGITLGFFGAYNLNCAGDWAVKEGSQNWTLQLSGDVEKSDYGSKVLATATDEAGKSCTLQVYFSEDNNLLCGQVVKANAAAKSLKTTTKEFTKINGVAASISVKDYEVAKLDPFREFVISARSKAIENFSNFSGAEAGVLQALVCGYKNTIKDEGTYDKFKICGLAHIVAVSGAHLAIVVGVLLAFLKFLKLSRKLSVAICIISVLAYLVFSGIPISAIRSAVMVILALAAGFFGRRSSPVNALCLCVVFFIAHDPAASLSISLFLSAASTLGIMLFASLFASYFHVENERANAIFVQPCSLTLASNLVTMPFSAAAFSQVSTIALFANIIATPLFTLGCVSGLIAAIIGCAASFLAPFACFVAKLCAFPLSASCDLMSKIPFAAVAVQANVYAMLALSFALCTVIYLKWPTFGPKALGAGALGIAAAAALLVVILPASAGVEVVMLDVGQGDSILVKSGANAVLIDTGNQKTKLKTALAQNGVYTLDALIITHHDDDHMGCLTDVATYENINSVYSSKNALSCDCKNCSRMKTETKSAIGKDLQGLNVGDKIKVGAFTLDVIWPEKYEDEGGNADSVCIKLTSDVDNNGQAELSMLLTGDAEKEQVKKMIKEGRVADIDVLKVGHHGSKISLDDENLDALSPKDALISAGANNRYGHPKEETLSFLQNHDVEIFRTDENGSVKVKPNAGGYTIEKEK